MTNAEDFFQRQLSRVPSFSTGKASAPDPVTGTADVNTAGRPFDRTGLATVLGQPLAAGSNALLLAGGDNDAAQIVGYLPFMGD